jgi:predicted nucleic acid-binding protein
MQYGVYEAKTKLAELIKLAVAAISREYKLTGYDAQYLELARRRNLPWATLDKDLRKASKRAGVPIYLMQ